MKTGWFGLIILGAGIFLVTGCATTDAPHMDQRLTLLSHEVARLDMTLQQTEAALEAERQRSAQLEQMLATGRPPMDLSTPLVDLSTNVYRTPSGFQIPAGDLQRALKNAGFYDGEIDGKIGPGTRRAIRAFQSENGLEPDGICGKQTWDSLKTHLTSAR